MPVPDLQLRPARHAEEVIAFAERFEPASTRMIAELLRWGLCRTNRGLVVAEGDSDDDVAAAVVVTRRCPDRWHATVVVDEPRAAPLVAAAVDASPAWSVIGATEFVAPLLSHLHRQPVGVDTVPFHGSDVPTSGLVELDPRVRLATEHDLNALVALYATFEQQDIPTRPRLRRFLRAALADLPIMVAEVEGRLVGAMRLDWPSRAYAFWWAQTVLPEYRGLGIGNGLMFNAMDYSGERGLRMSGTVGQTNPIKVMKGEGWRPYRPYDEHHLQGEWMTARLGPPRRAAAWRALRRGWETLQGRTRPR